MKQKKTNFEDSVKRLDEIVRHLESGDLSLDESLAMFEEGTELIKNCSTILDEAEQKVVLLRTGRDGSVSEEPFTGENDL